MPEESLIKRFKIKELELDSLLEVTQAINNNLSEEALYKIFDFTLRANLNIGKIALYVLENDWVCKVNFGTKTDFHQVALDHRFLSFKEPVKFERASPTDPFDEFSTAIPVLHKETTLAFVFAKGISSGPDEESSLSTITFLRALSNIIIVAIENKKLARQQLREEAMRKELEIARTVQEFLFPGDLPYGIRLKIEASYLPHQSVGGDYYDYIPINKNQFLMCIADVSGKGVPAAILMSNFQASLRTLVRKTPNLTEIIEELNYQILENAKGENFITFFVAIYDHQLKTLVYMNAGHNPPVLIDGNQKLMLLEEGTTVLGAFHPLPFINEGFLTDLDRFLYFSFTDGLTETENDQGEEFGLDRIKDFLVRNSRKDIRKIHKELLQEVDQFRGNSEYKDDITILSCKVEP